jgi:hypothetical protein
MVPSDFFTEVNPREHDENAKRDDFLDDFQLKGREFAVADAVRWDLEAVLEERDHPAHDDNGQQGNLPEFQVTVPCNGHKNIGTDQKKDGFHSAQILSRLHGRVCPVKGGS